MYHLQRNEMYRLGDNAPKSYVVHRRLTVFPRDAAYAAVASIPAGRPPPAMGRNPSGTSALAYFRFHQKYWCSGMPFSFNRALIAVPFSRASPGSLRFVRV